MNTEDKALPLSQGDARQHHSVATVYVVDDQVEVLNVVRRLLKRADVTIHTFDTCHKLCAAIDAGAQPVDVVLSDLYLGDGSGLDILDHMKSVRPDVPVVIMTGQATIDSAITAIRKGAYDYLVKPFDPMEALATTVLRAAEHRKLLQRNRYLESRVRVSERFEGIVGNSRGMQQVFQMVASVAPTDATVLIHGESGTGKELIARAIHERSKRSSRPYVVVNCGALSETLLESELFGHVRGAFTGAATSRKGVFEEASEGTLFLDEIGELSPATQVKLLRVLQEGEVRPVGSSTTRQVNVRVIAATHRNLKQLADSGSFRHDLFYRLNVFQVSIPPLHQRKEDIALLAHHLVEKHAMRLGRDAPRIGDEALALLQAYAWPGNVRELENVIERGLILTSGDVLNPSALPDELQQHKAQALPEASSLLSLPLSDAKLAFERKYLERLVKQVSGNTSEAARLSGVDRSNLRRLLRRHGIEPESHN